MMKNVQLIGILLFGFLCCSCSSDDNEGGSSTSIDGTYFLTAYNVSPAVDANGDGTASSNQMVEVSCFDNDRVALSSGSTATIISGATIINLSGATPEVGCATLTTLNGGYARNGDAVAISYFGADGFAVTLDFTLNGSSLIRTIPNGSVVSDDGTGNPTTVNAAIELIYTK